MSSMYSSSYGHHEPSDDPEADREFYEHVVNNQVEKVCQGCDQKTMMMPDHGYCNSCADKIERGQDLC